MSILPSIDFQNTCRKIEEFIRRKVEEANANGVVIGLSGGVDSSVTAFLCQRALGPSKVLGLIMPDKDATLESDVKDAEIIAMKLGIEYKVIEISSICKAIELTYIPEKKDLIASGNIRPRVRMTILYYVANKLKRLVVGTSDKSEIMIGYFTKYGDSGADLFPLGGLYKTQVRELARFLGVPEHIVMKPSSPGFWRGHLAEDEIGISYDIIDQVLYGMFDLRMNKENVAKKVGVPIEIVERVDEMVKKSKHKRMFLEVAEI